MEIIKNLNYNYFEDIKLEIIKKAGNLSKDIEKNLLTKKVKIKLSKKNK